MKPFLEDLFQGRSLTATDARTAFGEILDGEHAPTLIAAFLGAIQSRGVTADELGGFARALMDRAIPIPNLPSGLIDVCGTGGDGAGTFNVSTAVALVLAGGGVKVAKHGNRSVSSRCGSTDVLDVLGVSTALDPTQFVDSVQKTGFGFLAAPSYHPGLARWAPLRKEIGVRTVFNLMGPLVNPAHTKRQLIGVYDRNVMLAMAETFHQLGGDHGWVVRGRCGLDEISLTDATDVVEMKNGSVQPFVITPEQFGFARSTHDAIRGGDAETNSRIITGILRGDPGPCRDVVVLNAAAGFHVAGVSESIEQGCRLAEAAIDSGVAYSTLETLRTLRDAL